MDSLVLVYPFVHTGHNDIHVFEKTFTQVAKYAEYKNEKYNVSPVQFCRLTVPENLLIQNIQNPKMKAYIIKVNVYV